MDPSVLWLWIQGTFFACILNLFCKLKPILNLAQSVRRHLIENMKLFLALKWIQSVPKRNNWKCGAKILKTHFTGASWRSTITIVTKRLFKRRNQFSPDGGNVSSWKNKGLYLVSDSIRAALQTEMRVLWGVCRVAALTDSHSMHLTQKALCKSRAQVSWVSFLPC